MIDPNEKHLSVRAQCNLINLSESTYVYRPTDKTSVNDFLHLVNEIS